MRWTKENLKNADKVFRLNLINGITGAKPANLIGTQDEKGQTNLAIFSSVVHLGSNPALLGLIVRPSGDVPRNTYENIKTNGYYTINHVPIDYIENAHYTSAKFDKTESEFAACGFKEEYVEGFKAPFVAESSVKLGMKFVQEIPIELNNTILLIGEIEHLILPDYALNSIGHLDLEKVNTAAISGLNTYYSMRTLAQFPYARVHELPDFTEKK
jgi:flavin reductase (DIM6/NTAB) family NADH-FMN oxidoreductase RutF|tara:strand:+ start:23733 stop:24374 length:642 start_codon:yes stop_codon:yes gene_type:complete